MRASFRAALVVTVLLGSAVTAFVACVDDATGSGSTDAGSDGEALPFDSSGGDVVGNDSGPGNDAADAGADTGPKRHCATVAPPVGSSDFLCADFDGTSLSEGWTTTLKSDAGVLEVTTSVATSTPNALLTQGVDGVSSGEGGALAWHAVGAQAFASATIRAHMNGTAIAGAVPSYTGHVQLLQIITTNALVELDYTRGGTLGPPASKSNYTGYYIASEAFGGAAVAEYFDVATPVPTSSWTDVDLTWLASGSVTLTYNGISILSHSAIGSTDTSIDFSIGELSIGSVTMPEAMRYDDVELSTTRQ